MIAELATSEARAAVFAVPVPEKDEFYRLPEALQAEVIHYLRVLKMMAVAPQGKRTAIATEFHRAMGCARGTNPKSLNRKLNNFIESGYDWRVLVDEARLPKKRQTHPPEFIEYWKGLYESNQRTCPGAAAHRALVREFQVDEKFIPGYGTWRDHWQRLHPHSPLPVACPPDFVPAAWDYATLIKYKSAKVEKELASYGIAAAVQLLPKIPTTRDGMRFMEWVVLDDVQTDFLICVDDCPQPVVLKCIVALDLATGMILRVGARPAIPRDDGTTQGLMRRDTKCLVAGMFMSYGIPRDYICNIILERGTATISPEDAAALAEGADGQVEVHWTKMLRGTAVLGGFADRSYGNPTGKTWVESIFNPMHNDLGFLPGQTGSTYELRPAELEGRARELKELEKAGAFIPPTLRQQLRRPFRNFHEARVTLTDLAARYARRTAHNLEGFERVRDWRWKTNDPHAPWRAWSELPVLPAGAENQIELSSPRPESPLERWHRLIQGCTFEKPCESAMRLFLEKHHDFVTVKGGLITIKIEGREYFFYEPDSELLREGAKYLAYYSRADLEDAAKLPPSATRLDCLYLTDGKGAYKGRLPLDRRIRRTDVEALAERTARKQHELNVVRRNISQRPQNVARMEQREQDIDTNLEVFRNAEASDVAPIPPGASAPQPEGRRGVVSDLVTAEAADAASRTEADRAVRAAHKINVVDLMRKKKPGVTK